MYSLIGLYDLSQVSFSTDQMPQVKLKNASRDAEAGTAKAHKLFNEGVESLKRHLPLYDTGSGSIYDLRHTGLKTAPNLARLKKYFLSEEAGGLPRLAKRIQMIRNVIAWVAF